MTHIEKMWKTIEKAEKEYIGKRDGYCVSAKEVGALIDYSESHKYEGTFAAFNLGFIRGVRWAKAQKRKKAVKA